MWKLFPVFLLLLAAPRFNAQSTAQPAAGQSRILALENAWNQAVQQKDTAALEMLLGPELVYVDYDGKLMDKAEYLASVQSPSLQPERIVSESMNVHLYGAVAVVNGVYRENGAKKGKPYVLKERFTDTWVRRSESWVCVASQSTLILH
jgi:ketosteroid isomerase-like protein